MPTRLQPAIGVHHGQPVEPEITAEAEFDPRELTGDASVNRLVIAALAGVPAALVGRRAHDVLSADAVTALCADSGVVVSRDSVADGLGARLRSPDAGVRRAAGAAVAEVGLRLACVLATLREPGTALAQGWNPWRRAYLRHWASVEEVHLAGGLLCGDVGPAVVGAAGAALARLGVPTRTALHPMPAWAGLTGAALLAGAGAGAVLGVDVGGSRAKTALVRASAAETVELVPFPPRRVPFGPLERVPTDVLDGFLAEVLSTAAGSARGLGADVRAVAIAVACYLRDGRPSSEHGIYANLPDLRGQAWSGRLEALFGPGVAVSVVHDGTAAAAAPTPAGRRSATLVLGSSVGVGFPPPGRERR
jgi:hypothetical protein